MFWEAIHKRLQYLHGRQSLSAKRSPNFLADLEHYFVECSDEDFLTFVETIFKTDEFWHEVNHENEFVSHVNEFLRQDSLPYTLTGFVYGQRTESLYGRDQTVRYLSSYPQIIRREDEILHQTAIQPTLTLLADPAFNSANEEFLEGLGHYRKGEYKDCVTKCASSLESVMKVICDRKGWSHPGNAEATVLLNTILPKTNLPPFFKNPLQLVSIIRNELSSVHGAGTQTRTIERHMANFVINSTASTILLLVEETAL